MNTWVWFHMPSCRRLICLFNPLTLLNHVQSGHLSRQDGKLGLDTSIREPAFCCNSTPFEDHPSLTAPRFLSVKAHTWTYNGVVSRKSSIYKLTTCHDKPCCMARFLFLFFFIMFGERRGRTTKLGFNVVQSSCLPYTMCFYPISCF